MTGEELYAQAKMEEEAAGMFMHPWENLSADERAGWDRKAAEEFSGRKGAAEAPAESAGSEEDPVPGDGAPSRRAKRF